MKARMKNVKYIFFSLQKEDRGPPHNNNPQQVWQGIQTITNFRGRYATAAWLAEQLNGFFAHFEKTWSIPPPQPPSASCTKSISLLDEDVRRVLNAVTDQLSQVLTDIYSIH